MEILELAGQARAQSKVGQKMRITPRHIQLAIRNDDELSKLFAMVQISKGGVMPNIEADLWKKKGAK